MKKNPIIELKSRRERLGLSQSQMAGALGVSLRTYQGWELGRPYPDYLLLAIKWIEHLQFHAAR